MYTNVWQLCESVIGFKQPLYMYNRFILGSQRTSHIYHTWFQPMVAALVASEYHHCLAALGVSIACIILAAGPSANHMHCHNLLPQYLPKSRGKDYQIKYTNIWLTHKQLETHGCELSIVLSDALALRHQAISTNKATVLTKYSLY